MKTQIFLFVFLIGMTSALYSQDKKITKDGHIWFFSHTSVEDIEAHSHQAAAVYKIAKDSIAIVVPMMSFEFKKTLMQEHFNENYMESAKYPKAKFLGLITNSKEINLSKDGTYKVSVDGKLTMHNVTKNVKADGTIEVKGGKITMKSKFSVAPKDYNVVVESRFSGNIAPSIDVNVEITF
jgi:polyisoprenoid-binding protein YceI